ncbi:MAG: hypothetical protein JO107_04650 [Hyphomicrobiales bacterium]|nr:hypothetical protein [Hyphomicrobiales bacterium]
MVKKLVILAFEDDRYRKSAGSYEAQINPEKYSEALSVDFDVKQKVNPAGVTAKYKGQGPRNLSLDFILDDTGVIENTPKSRSRTVTARIQDFKDVAYDFDGAIHRPRYLRILWGALKFDCVLKKLDIDYTLFSPGGRPLRALLKAEFLHYASAQKTELQGRKQSSDLTHVRQVGAGDTLPLMCHRIYGDSTLYLQVAKFNDLTNFRDLPTSLTINFPPLAELMRGGGER